MTSDTGTDTIGTPELYYDPYDFDIDADPYPIWKRMRDEAPLYYNERYEFYAVSRFADVQACSLDWETYISGKGTVLEMIRSGVEMPPGMFIFEDPPAHDLHRGLLSRVFTPKRMLDLEPKVRAYCRRALDEALASEPFDLIADLGTEVPMRTIGMLLGIPEADQEGIRASLDESLRLDEGTAPEVLVVGNTSDDPDAAPTGVGMDQFAEYIDWRAEHPSDDLMTELLNAEFTDIDGTTRTLTRTEVLNYVGLLAGAGNETTTRLIGWAGTILAAHPDQRAELVEDPGLIPGAIEELLRYEAPSPVQSRVVTKDVTHHGATVPAGSILVMLNGAANRDEREFEDPDRFDIHREIRHHLSFGHGIHFCLGSHLARLEGRVTLEELLHRVPEWEIDWDRAVQAHTSTVRGWESLPLHLP